RPRGLAANVDDVCAVVKQAKRQLGGALRVKSRSGIRERIRCDVHDPHHQRAKAKLNRARPQTPLEAGACHPAECNEPPIKRLSLGGTTYSTLWKSNHSAAAWFPSSEAMPAGRPHQRGFPCSRPPIHDEIG